MANYVIAGKPDCSSTVHAIFVARYLEKKLPNFKVHIIQMRTGKWEKWLYNLNKKNTWYVTQCPVIWKEIVEPGSKPHLIGGICEFWEYCYDYYGIESLVTKQELEDMVADNMQFFEYMEEKKIKDAANIRKILITGATNPMISLLLPELLEVPNLAKESGMIIKLYDTYSDKNEDFLQEIINDFSILAGQIIKLVKFRSKALATCDILIIIDDYSRKENELENVWMQRNRSEMLTLAQEINLHAKTDLRVIFACNGPICYNATVLAQNIRRIKIKNIVAVTSDKGLAPLSVISKQCDIPIEKLSGPPVWGFIGINQFVDIDNTLLCYDMLRPYQRTVYCKEESTLPQGTIRKELRQISYLTDQLKDFDKHVKDMQDIVEIQLKHEAAYSKVRATISLLNLWYQEEPNDKIISLGVYSFKENYGLPKGIVFSQPCYICNKVWKAFPDLSVAQKSKKILNDLAIAAIKTMDKWNQDFESTNLTD